MVIGKILRHSRETSSMVKYLTWECKLLRGGNVEIDLEEHGVVQLIEPCLQVLDVVAFLKETPHLNGFPNCSCRYLIEAELGHPLEREVVDMRQPDQGTFLVNAVVLVLLTISQGDISGILQYQGQRLYSRV